MFLGSLCPKTKGKMQIRSQEKVQIVKDYCSKFKDLPNHTLARMVYKKHGALFPSLEAARSSIRGCRGNNGSKMRKCCKKELYRPNGQSGFAWSMPKSIAPSYDAFSLDEPRTLILSDLHIPFHDPDAIEVSVDRAVPLNPTCILLNGDVCDFFSASRFDKNPTESSIKLELNSTREFLGWLRQKFPKARIIYKLGNHDEWFDKYIIRKAPELFGVAGVNLKHLTTAKIDGLEEVGGIEWVEDQRKIQAGHLSIWHGHEIGKGSIAPPVNPARGLFMRTMECGLMGHLHKHSSHEETSSNGKLISTWSTGCLCGLHPKYSVVNKWTQSCVFLTMHKGDFSIDSWRILNGRIL